MSGEAKQNVLIVDDSAASLKMAAHLISRPGREVFLARNGAEALELVSLREYDLMLLDIMMPGISGFELCTQLKAIPATAETPIIFLSAVRDEASLIKGFELGAADYVSKPFNPQELNARVDTQLKLSQQRRQINHKIRDLELLNQQLDAFSYSASHDLKSPLFSINSYISAIKERHGSQLDKDARDMIDQISAAGQRMAHLIEDLLAFSRSTAELNTGLVDLSAIAGEIAVELQRSNPQRQVSFDIQPGLTVLGDNSLLRSVMQNLVGNAWKYSGKTEQAHIRFGQVPRTESGIELSDDEILCFVADNGAGFDPTQTARLFQPFQRLHSTREYEGHGLGLVTAKRIINRHNGRIWAESQLGEGARFLFTLPSIKPGPRQLTINHT